MFEVADVFRLCGQGYVDAFGDRMPPRHLKAIQDIQACRTEELGGQVYLCEACGKHHYEYHSCFNRSCPKCHGARTEAWLGERESEILGVPYFHLVFTLPHELHELTRSHQAEVYGILMQAAAQSLLKLARDPRYVGGLLGILSVLHTWSRTLDYHPHVHCLVPAGGIDDDQRWIPARQSYLVPVRALSVIFRGMFRDLLRERLPQVNVPGRAWKKSWNVYCKPAIQGAHAVLSYLGRYVHRVAIANSRITNISNAQVSFKYQDSSSSRWHNMTLDAQEFMRRFLQHVLPKGFHKVRYYGFWAPPCRDTLRRLLLILPPTSPSEPTPQDPDPPATPDNTIPEHPPCPHCHQPALVLLKVIPRPKRGPPHLCPTSNP